MPAAQLRRTIRDAATLLDEAIVARRGVRSESPSLVTLMFHNVFESRAEIARDLAFPQEAVTRDAFRGIVEHLLAAGYRFVTPAEIVAGCGPERLACLTFDDGYAGNLRIVDVLHEFEAPATIFVTTRQVETGERFWWDVVWSERRRRGQSARRIGEELRMLGRRRAAAIESYLAREFGRDARTPRGEADRPLSPSELKALSEDALVTIGNHTTDHVLLTELDGEDVRAQLLESQRYLEDVTGARPLAVAYPDGAYDAGVLAEARDIGFACGFTTRRRKDRLPVDAPRLLELGRFRLRPGRDVDRQLQVIRSEGQLVSSARRAFDRLKV